MIQNTLRANKPAQPLLGIVLIVSACFMTLSLVSYSSSDPSWNFSSSHPGLIQNWAGQVGSFLADGLLQSLGLVAYVFTLSLFFIGFQKMKDKEIEINSRKRNEVTRPKWKLPLALSASLLFTSGLLSLTPFSIYDGISAGGFLGFSIANFGVYAFSTAGAALLFLGGLWAAVALMNEKFARLPKTTAPKINFNFSAREKLSSFFKRFRWPNKADKTAASLNQKTSQLSQKLDELFKQKKPKEQTENDEVSANSAHEEENIKKPDIEDQDVFKKKLPLFSFSRPKKEASSGERKFLIDTIPKRKRKNEDHGDFEFPSLQLLDKAPDEKLEISREELIENSKTLEQKLFDFGIQGSVRDIKPGPIITMYEFEPAPGIKVKNIINLADDLKLAMKALSIRIVAPIPGKAAVGIEIPNHKRQMVVARDLLGSALFQNSNSPLTIAMGKNTGGDAFVADLAKMPHLLIAGATGSGKSVGLNCMIISMLYKAAPDELKFIMIDPKMLELSVYEGIPHLLLPVVTDPKKASRALHWAVKEMERRYKLISSLGARNLRSYNEKVERLSSEELEREIELAKEVEEASHAYISDEDENPKEAKSQRELFLEEMGMDHYVKLPVLCIVIDELADLMMVAGREVEESITRLAQMARAAGIHLILATQRPSVDVITGVIKANFPTRVAYQVASKVDSRTIIDGSGAENLIGDGDMLFLPPGTSRLERLHGPFISEDEIDRVVKHLRTQRGPDYADHINLEEAQQRDSESLGDDVDDELYDQALHVVFETQSPSASMIQRRLRVGYNRAARLIERMESEGIVSSPQGSGKGRELLVQASDYQ